MKILFGNICRDLIGVYLFSVLWSMYSSDRMKTLLRLLKDCNKNIVFMDCQIHLYLFIIYLRRKQILLIFFRHFVELSAKSQPLLDYFWDISRDLERLQRTTTLCGRLETKDRMKNWCTLAISELPRQTFLIAPVKPKIFCTHARVRLTLL